jgi:hypothetical protein
VADAASIGESFTSFYAASPGRGDIRMAARPASWCRACGEMFAMASSILLAMPPLPGLLMGYAAIQRLTPLAKLCRCSAAKIYSRRKPTEAPPKAVSR